MRQKFCFFGGRKRNLSLALQPLQPPQDYTADDYRSTILYLESEKSLEKKKALCGTITLWLLGVSGLISGNILLSRKYSELDLLADTYAKANDLYVGMQKNCTDLEEEDACTISSPNFSNCTTGCSDLDKYFIDCGGPIASKTYVHVGPDDGYYDITWLTGCYKALYDQMNCNPEYSLVCANASELRDKLHNIRLIQVFLSILLLGIIGGASVGFCTDGGKRRIVELKPEDETQQGVLTTIKDEYPTITQALDFLRTKVRIEEVPAEAPSGCAGAPPPACALAPPSGCSMG